MNFVITNSFWPALQILTGPLFGDEPVHKLAPSLNKRDHVNMLDILTMAGIFPSKGQARKNWNGPVEIPWGFNQWTVGKHKQVITVWKPIPDPSIHLSLVANHHPMTRIVGGRGSFFFKVRKLAT